MTIAELLALVGRAWSRLALYPGGLAVLVALWLAAAPPWARGRETPDARGETPDARPETEDATEDIESRHVARSTQHATLTLSSIVLPWLAVALLPLPYAAPLGRPVDLVVALALLEWPRLLAVARDLRDEGGRPRALRRLAAMLNGYPPLVLVALVIGQGAGSLELGLIAAAPQERAPALVRALYWLGAAAWLLALPPLLELGPFACDPARTQGVRLLRAGRAGAGGLERPRVAALALGMQLRAVGLVLIAALPWLELLPAAREDGAPVLWLVPLPALLVAVLAWGFGQLTARQAARPWALGYLWLSAALLGALVCAAAAALRERLT